MSSRSERQRLEDILDRIERIKFAETALLEAEEEDDWEEGQIAFDAILYDLVVIGEAVKTLGMELKGLSSTTPWKKIAGMRDILANEYFRVSGEVVMATLDIPLTELKVACETELKRLGTDASKKA